jgi:hypothetical protein
MTQGDRQPVVLAVGALGLAAVLTAAAVVGGARDRAPLVTRSPRPDEVLAHVDRVDPASADARSGALAPGSAGAGLDPTAASAGGPGALAAALAIAARDVDDARRRGDPRLLGHAQAALAGWWDLPAPPAEVLLLRATIRQGLHDFAGARADLDALLVRFPDGAQARLTRAVVATVQGDLARAAADCARVTVIVDELTGAACAAPLATRSGGTRAAHQRLGALLADAPAASPIVPWALTARGELARALADDVGAERLFRAALAQAPGDLYTLAQLADLLLDAGRDREVDVLLRGAAAEPLVLRRAIALRRTGDREAPALAARLRAELAAAAARGDDTHLRERARFFLDVDPQPALALAAARGNWLVQREAIDVRTLLDAATAARAPVAAAPALAWLDAGAIDDAVLARARARLLALAPARTAP